MKRILFFVLCSLIGSISIAQSPKKTIKKLGNNPVFFIDSVNVDNSEIQKYDPNEIAQITVYNNKEATELFGEDGKDGAVYIFTKKYTKTRYWLYFQSRSDDYKRLVPTAESDTAVQYILNKRVLKENFEGDLFVIDDSIFKSIRLLSKDILLKEFNISGKEFGFQIISDTPDNLYHGKKKF